MLGRAPPRGVGLWTGAAKVGDGSGRTCSPEGAVTGAAWVGDTFGATGERPTGAARVGERFGAVEGGLAIPEDPPADEGDDAEPADPPEEAPPPDEEPPDEDPDCEKAATGINSAATIMRVRTGCLLVG